MPNQSLSKPEMTKLVQGAASKSDKMRILAKAGYSRADIARFLGARYQFVRNVLVREEARTKSVMELRSERGSHQVQLGTKGQVALPATMLQQLGWQESEPLIATVEDEEIRLMTVTAAVRKAQAIVRQFVPANVSLVDELLEDRRREGERD